MKISNINLLLHNINDNGKVEIYKYYDLCNPKKLTIKNKSILLFEANNYHYECSPGYAKYFIDLGFYVDLLIHKSGRDSFCLFEQKDKIRLFIYDSLDQINLFSYNLSIYMKKYNFIVIQTIHSMVIKTISNLGLLSNKKSIFIFHYTYYYDILNFSNIENQKRIWTLGHFPIGLRVVPFYFGKINLKEKNRKTRFFTVSTVDRNYNFLISASEKIKEENLDFEVVVVGSKKHLSAKNINNKTRENFIFKYNANFPTLYNQIYNSDYIIITLDPDRNEIFNNKKVTGSAQLSYGFLKPVLIEEHFKNIYNMTPDNSFIYNKNNFYNVMKNAILLNTIYW